MITEERTKELAEAYALCLILPDRMDADASRDELEELRKGLEILNDQLIRTVAAEARKEGMEEGYRAGFMHAAAEPDRHLENSLYEWLKEQGK